MIKAKEVQIDDRGRLFAISNGRRFEYQGSVPNERVVRDNTDLPFNSANQRHELKDNTVYRLAGFITSPYPIKLGNQTPIIGGHGSNDGFIYTGGTSAAIRGTNNGLFLRNTYFHAPGATIFNIEGDVTTEVLVESCSFSDAAGLGNIASLGTIDGMRVPSFKGCNFEDFDDGILFTGNSTVPDKVFFTGCPFRRVSESNVTAMEFDSGILPEVVDITDCYIKDIQSDTEVVRVQSGATPTSIFQYRGNTHDSSVDPGQILNGEASVETVGYRVTDSAPLRDSTAIGEFNMVNETTTTISSQNTWVKVAGSGTMGNETERMQETATNGQIEYLGRKRTNVLVNVSGSVSLTANETYSIAIAKNGTVEPTSISQQEGQGINKPISMITSGIEDLVTGDTLSVYVRNNDGTSDAIFNSYNFNIVSV